MTFIASWTVTVDAATPEEAERLARIEMEEGNIPLEIEEVDPE